MADNVAITAGSGTTIAADEVVDGTLGTVKVQYVKLMDGTLDGTSKALVGANGLAVLATGTGTFAATQSGTWTVQPGNTPNTSPWLVTAGHGKTIKTATGTASSSGNNTLVAAVSSKRIKVIAYSLITASTTAVTAIFQDGASGTALYTIPLQAITGTNFGANLSTTAPSFLLATSATTLLNLNLSAAQSVVWSVTYFDDDAT